MADFKKFGELNVKDEAARTVTDRITTDGSTHYTLNAGRFKCNGTTDDIIIAKELASENYKRITICDNNDVIRQQLIFNGLNEPQNNLVYQSCLSDGTVLDSQVVNKLGEFQTLAIVMGNGAKTARKLLYEVAVATGQALTALYNKGYRQAIFMIPTYRSVGSKDCWIATLTNDNKFYAQFTVQSNSSGQVAPHWITIDSTNENSCSVYHQTITTSAVSNLIDGSTGVVPNGLQIAINAIPVRKIS